MVKRALEDVLGLGPARSGKLAELSIASPFELLARCRAPEGRRRVALASGIPMDELLDWALTADLLRVRGIDGPRARLLRAAAVDGVMELRHRHPEALTARLATLGGPEVARLAEVAGWIDRAARLSRVVRY